MNRKDLLTPDHVARILMFTYGKMVDSKPFWCFLAVKPSRSKELQQRIASKTFDINNYEKEEYGEIVVSGAGVMPPNDIIKQLSVKFNVPIRDMFKDFDQDAVISEEIKKLGALLNEG